MKVYRSNCRRSTSRKSSPAARSAAKSCERSSKLRRGFRLIGAPSELGEKICQSNQGALDTNIEGFVAAPAATKGAISGLKSKRSAQRIPFLLIECMHRNLPGQHGQQLYGVRITRRDGRHSALRDKVQTHATASGARASAAHGRCPLTRARARRQRARGHRGPDQCRRSCLRYVTMIKNPRNCPPKLPASECEGAREWAGVSILRDGVRDRTRPDRG